MTQSAEEKTTAARTPRSDARTCATSAQLLDRDPPRAAHLHGTRYTLHVTAVLDIHAVAQSKTDLRDLAHS